MLTAISFNRPQLFKKVILQVVLFAIFILSLIIIVRSSGEPSSSYHLLLAIIFSALFLVFNVFILIQLLFLPVGVSIDNPSKKMEIKFLLLGSKTIQIADIEAYSSTIIYTKKKDLEGILLHLKAGKKFLLSNFNLKDYKPVEVFFKKSKVKYLGKEDFGFIAYYRQSFK